jgi:glycerol-3-phosphate dehydrogenase subunit C
MTKCPYVPPHEFDLDFPHLILRARLADAKRGRGNAIARALAEMDRNGRLAAFVSPLINWAGRRSNKLVRALMEKVAGIDSRAELPKFHTRTFVLADRGDPIKPNAAAPAYGTRKAVIFPTCFVNYNKPATGMAARAVLNHIGVETKVVYPGCCGMPFLEQADLARVSKSAKKIAANLRSWLDDGWDVVTLTASCGLMLKFEWPLLVENDPNVKSLAQAVYDIDQYVVEIAKKPGLPPGLSPIEGGVSVHLACHARAQNMGPKAAELLKLIPATDIDVIERCAGHGGTFGVLKPTHDVARKVGAPTVRMALRQDRAHLVSDCPLAAKHIVQGMSERAPVEGGQSKVTTAEHPIEIFAKAYGLSF